MTKQGIFNFLFVAAICFVSLSAHPQTITQQDIEAIESSNVDIEGREFPGIDPVVFNSFEDITAEYLTRPKCGGGGGGGGGDGGGGGASYCPAKCCEYGGGYYYCCGASQKCCPDKKCC